VTRTPTGFSPETKTGINTRDGERCTLNGPGCKIRADDHPNHRLNRGSGGTSDPITNSTANGCAICSTCNWRIEVNADIAEHARALGIKLEHGADPTAVPLWSPFYGQWIRLLVEVDGFGSVVLEWCEMTGITDSTLDAREHETWLVAA
jgi:hypothetical protein